MKSLLNKWFHPSEEGVKSPPPAALPVPVSIHSLPDHHKRAMVGWIANRMGQLLQMEGANSGTYIYNSFCKEALDLDGEDDEDKLMYWASVLFGWLSDGRDVYLQLKEARPPDRYHKCLLHIYEEIKEDVRQLMGTRSTVPERENFEDEVWHVYRDVIYAVTQRKFLLIYRGEVENYRKGNVLCEACITERSDIPKTRELVQRILGELGFGKSEMMSYLLVISEAATNILKHAIEGKITMIETDSALHVLVEDRGPGFPLKLLPNSVLMAGYSTKKSLGQGFTIMMKMTELVLLSTVPGEGSTLILVFKRAAKEEEQHAREQPIG